MGDKRDSSWNLESSELKGWKIEESTDYKIEEMQTAKENWNKKINRREDILQTLHEIDSIMNKNNKELRLQISGEDYNSKTFQESEISELTLRLTDSLRELRKIQNYFFQNIEENKKTRIKNTPVMFEINPSYDETIEILSEQFDNIIIELPTMQSFFTTRINEKEEHLDNSSELFKDE